MKYKEYKGIDYAEIASEVLSKWKKENIFAKSIESREGAKSCKIYL
jgi:isoleucyl-tRNA synthetase